MRVKCFSSASAANSPQAIIITDWKFLQLDCCEMSLAGHFPAQTDHIPGLQNWDVWLISLLPSQQNCVTSSAFMNKAGICIPHHSDPLLCENWVCITAGKKKKKKKSRKTKSGSQSYFSGEHPSCGTTTPPNRRPSRGGSGMLNIPWSLKHRQSECSTLCCLFDVYGFFV